MEKFLVKNLKLNLSFFLIIQNKNGIDKNEKIKINNLEKKPVVGAIP